MQRVLHLMGHSFIHKNAAKIHKEWRQNEDSLEGELLEVCKKINSILGKAFLSLLRTTLAFKEFMANT